MSKVVDYQWLYEAIKAARDAMPSTGTVRGQLSVAETTLFETVMLKMETLKSKCDQLASMAERVAGKPALRGRSPSMATLHRDNLRDAVKAYRRYTGEGGK